MKLLKTKNHFSNKELYSIMKSQELPRAFLDWQIIYSVQINYGKKADEIASILGVSKHKVYSVIQSYNKYGKSWRSYDNWGGRREQRCNLSLSEEAEILKSVEKDALRGQILTYKHVKSKVEQKINRQVSDDYIWDMFKRHGWKKKVPRQSHPKSNIAAQEDFKKNSKRIWSPSLLNLE